MLVVGGVEHLGRVGDQRDQAAHRPLGLGHRGDQPRAAGGLGQPDVKAGRRPAGRRGSRRAARRARPPARRARRGPRARPARPPGPRSPPRPPSARRRPRASGQQLRRGRLGRRLRVGHERAAAAAAGRAQMAALAERHQRLAQRRAGDTELRAQLAFGGQARAGGSSPSLIAVPSRSTVSSNAVCERTGANTVSSDATDSSDATAPRSSLSAGELTAARIRGNAPSRSPRPRMRLVRRRPRGRSGRRPRRQTPRAPPPRRRTDRAPRAAWSAAAACRVAR